MLPAQIRCIFNYLSILELSEGYCLKPGAVTNVNLLACRKMQRCKLQRYGLHQYARLCRQFPEGAKDVSVSECTWTLSALEVLRDALYKFKSYLLTYLLVMSRVDYCNTCFAGSPTYIFTDKLHCVLTELCSTSCHWHMQVQPRLVTHAAQRVVLARHPRKRPQFLHVATTQINLTSLTMVD